LDDLFAILEHTVHLESELGLDGVVWSGDVFHHKQPSRTSHRLVQRAIALVQQYKHLWIVPGNHDMLNDRYDSLFESQPLGVLFQAGAELLSGWESTGEHPLYGVPWRQRWESEDIEEAFVYWHDPGPRFPDRYPLSKCLVVAHAPLYPPGLELPYEYYPAKDEEAPLRDSAYQAGRRGWSSIQGSGSCYYGHVHDRHGEWSAGSVTFCNQGAITRGSLHESELTRAIGVTTWSPDEGFRQVAVPHRPADEVFRLMEKRELEDAKEAIGDFLASIGAAQLEVTSVEAVLSHIRSLGLPAELVRTAEEILQSVQVGV
jgi:DNA repair exonuclease SbcCD nuclease subunit